MLYVVVNQFSGYHHKFRSEGSEVVDTKRYLKQKSKYDDLNVVLCKQKYFLY